MIILRILVTYVIGFMTGIAYEQHSKSVKKPVIKPIDPDLGRGA